MLRRSLTLACAAVLGACAAPAPRGTAPVADGLRADVAILETTDLHTHVLSYDYDRGRVEDSGGFDRVATLIRQARAEFANSLLIDDGDTLQGTALADYQALVQRPACGQKLAMHKAMDALGYDAGTIGNHEFNYGLPFLAQVTGTPMPGAGVDSPRCAGPAYPLVLSNVFGAHDGKPLYAPYAVIERRFSAYTADGSQVTVPLKVGVLGFTPTPILKWDKVNLDGRVTVQGMVEAAQRWLPELRAQGADIVIAVAHAGLNPAPYTPELENAGWHLAGVPGIDALLLGHSHSVFPAPNDPASRFASMPEVDNAQGFVRGVPAVMGGFYGQDLGVIRLALVRRDGRWQVDREHTRSEVRSVRGADGKAVPADPAIARAVQAEHKAALAWLDTPIGRSERRLSTVFADEGDVSALGVVNAAQSDFTARWIAAHRPELADVPVLSAAAAFKTGFAGPDDYTDIAPGPLTQRSAIDLYLYANTIAAVLTDGATVKAWLERSATRFNQIDPAKAEAQPLINKKLPGYNFDVLQGALDYTIDLSRTAGARIVSLRYRGEAVRPEQRFVVATNNYRATDAGIAGLDQAEVLFSGLAANRDVVVDYLRAHPLAAQDAWSQRPWQFLPLALSGPVTFTAPAGRLALAQALGLPVAGGDSAGAAPGMATYTLAWPH